MSAHDQSLVSLHCHPDTPCAAVESIKARVRWEAGNFLRVTYALQGVVEQLRMPPEGMPRRADDLWCHTCFELFVGAKNDAEYYEFNFSPSGQWAAYSFRDYRDGARCDDNEIEPEITVQRGAASLELSAVIRLDRLPGIQPNFCLSIGLSSVVEDLNGTLSYWALKHPLGKPDFHHPDNFALEFEPKCANGGAIDDSVKP
ncbi:MAG TPA: DOMON-like domain-containing protein [Candidatus Binatia bacterium]